MTAFTTRAEARRRLTMLASLSAAEWRVLIAAWFLLPSIAIALRVLDYTRTRDLMRRFATRNGTVAAPEVQLERVIRLVGVASRHGLCRANCLRQALAVWWLLARRGIETNLRIGVQKDRAGFSAHAWVEYDGVIIIGGADSRERYRAMN